MPQEHKEVYFYTPTPSELEGLGFAVTVVGRTRVLPSYRFGPLRKRDMTILVILDGRGTLQTPAQCSEFTRGDVVGILAGETCSWWTDPDHPLQHYWLSTAGEAGGYLLRRLGMDEHRHVLARRAVPPAEVAMFESLMRLLKEKPPGFVWRVNALLFALLHSIAVTARLHPPDGPAGTPGVAAEARQMIDAHYAEPITVRDLAAHVGVTPEHLATVFRHAYGIPPHAYLTNRRLERAKVLLRQGASVKEACFSVGYRDPNYFSR
ncbi:MAG TPA: AraC family transcriptional regulator, partial [Limnochordia bacterium]